MRRNRDRTPAAGTPRVRLTVELPHKWSSYLVNDVPDAFDDDDADDPWDRAAADREIAKIEAEGYTIVGQAGDGSFGRHGGTHGMLTTYQLVNHQAHADDAAAGLWRFMPPGTESEYLILHDTEGITWLPAHWSHKLSDPRYVIDEIDLEWAGRRRRRPPRPQRPALDRRRRDAPGLAAAPPIGAPAPGPRGVGRTCPPARRPQSPGPRMDTRPSPRRLPAGVVPRAVGPPATLRRPTHQRTACSRRRHRPPGRRHRHEETPVTRSGTRSRSRSAAPAALRRAQRTAAILHWRRAGASMAVIARGLNIGVGTVHRTLTQIGRRAARTLGKDTTR